MSNGSLDTNEFPKYIARKLMMEDLKASSEINYFGKIDYQICQRTKIQNNEDIKRLSHFQSTRVQPTPPAAILLHHNTTI